MLKKMQTFLQFVVDLHFVFHSHARSTHFLFAFSIYFRLEKVMCKKLRHIAHMEVYNMPDIIHLLYTLSINSLSC